jgi:hypothetical protein
MAVCAIAGSADQKADTARSRSETMAAKVLDLLERPDSATGSWVLGD